jgi:hypothetical protein
MRVLKISVNLHTALAAEAYTAEGQYLALLQKFIKSQTSE